MTGFKDSVKQIYNTHAKKHEADSNGKVTKADFRGGVLLWGNVSNRERRWYNTPKYGLELATDIIIIFKNLYYLPHLRWNTSDKDQNIVVITSS